MASAGPVPSGANAPRFQGVRTIHKGAQNFVQLAVDHANNDENVAIKYVPRDFVASNCQHILREVSHHHQLSLCKHPHVVGLHEVFLTPRYLGIVMEYVDGQSLQAFLVRHGGRLPEDVARFIFQQLVMTVDFVHKKGKVNRDIKLTNVLIVQSGNSLPLIKLCSFGLVKDRVDDSAPHSQVGSALFTAPEVILNVQAQPYEGEPVDVWSCGVVLHMMLFGCHPFLSPADAALSEAEGVVKLIENVVKGRLQLPDGARETPAADLLCRVLVPAPKERYSVQDIVLHPWFQTKLPPGALNLNCSYLQTSKFEDVRQAPAEIKKIIKASAQPVMPPSVASAPAATPAPAAGAASASSRKMETSDGLRIFSLSDDHLRQSAEARAAAARELLLARQDHQ